MAVFSVLRKVENYRNILLKLPAFSKSCVSKSNLQNSMQVFYRSMSDDGPRKMYITPSRFNYSTFKDDMHFYVALGVIPISLLIFFVNIFVGPAELVDIPEGYEPKFWEYHKHPIKRFFCRHFHQSPQQHHEMQLHVLNELQERYEWSEISKKVKKLQKERDDYKGMYFVPSELGKYYRYFRKEVDRVDELKGFK